MNRVQRTNYITQTVVVKETIQGELVKVEAIELKHGDILEFDAKKETYKKVSPEALGTDTRYRIYKGQDKTFKEGEQASVSRAGVFDIALVKGLPDLSGKGSNENREKLISRLETHGIYLEEVQ